MANEEHLCILKQGVKAWNQWREDNPGIRPNIAEANFLMAELKKVNLSEAQLRRAVLIGVDLSEANLSNSDLSEVDCREAYLRRADLRAANLGGARLSRAYLIDADLNRAYLNEAHLNDVNLGGANLSGAYLIEADLAGANLIGTDFKETVLHGANFSHAIVGWTAFGNVDLSGALGLETVHHQGPSTIGIDTIYRSNGNIPEAFLRGAGVPEGLITYIHSLVGQPVQFYSCFISYSSKDQAVAERLHADLQSKGTRCWFAPENMKIGDRIRQRIDQSIRLYDRLLLILSKHSIESDWVESEVEAALEEESRRKRTVLFPIRLDESVMETEQAWAALIRRTRHIGDFSRWKDHDAYQEAFDRLLRDLEVEDATAET